MKKALVAGKQKAFLYAMVVLTLSWEYAFAEGLRKQLSDSGPVESLTQPELETLGDPFFRIVLRDHAGTTGLKEIEELIQPDPTKRRLFIVDENLANAEVGQTRRSVIAFRGTNPPTGEILDGNVMLSVFFSSAEFSDAPAAIEVLAWDSNRGRYNYYKMDRAGSVFPRVPSWKFRGSSAQADLMAPDERDGSCMQCHINGGPIMKEFLFPWNNWHSFKFPADYIKQQWPVRSSPRLATLAGAEELETEFIRDAVSNFNDSRISSSLTRREDSGEIALDGSGRAQVFEGRRLLRSLFETTEVNLISSQQLSGMHPFSGRSLDKPVAAVAIPGSVFLNVNLIAGGGATDYEGLGIPQARSIDGVAIVTPDEYRQLVLDAGVELGGQKPGDANFAWFVPEPSHIDNSMVDRLLRRGVISPQFAAAALAVDLERPIFSSDRASLLRFVPEQFLFRPRQRDQAPTGHPDGLTTAVVTALRGASPAPGSPEERFLHLLESTDPVAIVAAEVENLVSRTRERLGAPGTRAGELQRLMGVTVQRRELMKEHPVLGHLDETGDRLLPLP